MNKSVAIGLGIVIGLAPLAAVAQTEQLAQAAPAATAPDTSMASPAAKHTGSHRGHIRRKGNTAGHRARASAHHMHHMRTQPAAPAEAPKS
jgi:hypothetical protein